MAIRIDHYAKNPDGGRDIIVGDIHGCFTKLERALRAISFNSTDRLFMLGDLIDRGPESHLVLEFFRRYPNAFSILGNHEDSIVRMIDGEKGPIEHIACYGGGWIARLGIDHDLPFEILNAFADFFRQLPIAIEIETSHGLVALVHASCPYKTWSTFRACTFDGSLRVRDALSSRDFAMDPSPQYIGDVHAVVVGHTPTDAVVPPSKGIVHKGNVIYADTGAWHGGNDTAAQFVLLDAATLEPIGAAELETAKRLDWSEE